MWSIIIFIDNQFNACKVCINLKLSLWKLCIFEDYYIDIFSVSSPAHKIRIYCIDSCRKSEETWTIRMELVRKQLTSKKNMSRTAWKRGSSRLTVSQIRLLKTEISCWANSRVCEGLAWGPKGLRFDSITTYFLSSEHAIYARVFLFTAVLNWCHSC